MTGFAYSPTISSLEDGDTWPVMRGQDCAQSACCLWVQANNALWIVRTGTRFIKHVCAPLLYHGYLEEQYITCCMYWRAATAEIRVIGGTFVRQRSSERCRNAHRLQVFLAISLFIGPFQQKLHQTIEPAFPRRNKWFPVFSLSG